MTMNIYLFYSPMNTKQWTYLYYTPLCSTLLCRWGKCNMDTCAEEVKQVTLPDLVPSWACSDCLLSYKWPSSNLFSPDILLNFSWLLPDAILLTFFLALFWLPSVFSWPPSYLLQNITSPPSYFLLTFPWPLFDHFLIFIMTSFWPSSDLLLTST